MITLKQDHYWNSNKIFLQVKWIFKKETFLNRYELPYVMRCIFDASRKVIKNFDSKIKGSFLESC